MNYEDIIAQALRLGFNPYAGNPSQMMARVGQYEVNPYYETTGGNEQDPGTSRQVGYVISDPLGGTTYRSDVVDMGGNLQRSNVHDAGSDKYGLGDMAKLAVAALGANALGSALGQQSMFSSGGLLGPAPGSMDAAIGSAMSDGGLATAGSGMTAGGSLNSAIGSAMSGAGSAGGGSAAGSALGSLSGKAIGGLLGAAAGAANSGDKETTSQQRLDPRMEALLYGADGKGGYLGAATEWFNQNKGGNPLMLQGAQMMADYYRSPQYTDGYNTLRNTGLGLLGSGMAGNPFTQPGGMPSSLGGGLPAMNMAGMGGGMPSTSGPQRPQAKVDAPPQAFDGGGGMMDMRYRGGPVMSPVQRRQREQDMQNMQLMAMRGFGG